MILETVIASAAENIGVAAIGFVAAQALEHIDDVADAGIEVFGSVAESGCELVSDICDSVFSLLD